jgi:hypothetical protein
LIARWCAAVAKNNELSLLSQIELRKRLERLNFLLFHLERDYQIRTSNQNEASRFQRGVYFLIFVGIVLLALGAASILDKDRVEWSALAGVAILFFLLIGKEMCSYAAVESWRRIESARYEFRELSGVRLFYDDLKLLQSDSEDEEDSPRLTEIIVESYEFLVERAWFLERHEDLFLGVGQMTEEREQ